MKLFVWEQVMKAIQFDRTSDGLSFSLAEVPTPQPAEGEVLIEVHAAGVIATELEWYPTSHHKNGEPRRHPIPGHEFSGTVAAVGKLVTSFTLGQEVYGMNDWFKEGATAEYCVAVPSSIALKPKSLSHVEAATVPISELTAWQGLFTRAAIQPGQRVLIQGGAGAVGLFVVQLAHRHEAHVIATASANIFRSFRAWEPTRSSITKLQDLRMDWLPSMLFSTLLEGAFVNAQQPFQTWRTPHQHCGRQ